MMTNQVIKVDLERNPQGDIDALTPDHRAEYDRFIERFPFQLDPFQVYTALALLQGHNALVTVPTSSGKTVNAEFGICHALWSGKRCVYTSPIKTLSNQKYSEFSAKFGHDQVGIITGDVKFNPDAPLLIMTTEILRDSLVKGDTLISELGTAVFDEVHYINDADRGHVWEECLMLLPAEVQLVLLSATISKPEQFAAWIGQLKQRPTHLLVHGNRVVPLAHYLYREREEGPGQLIPYFQQGKFNVTEYADYQGKFRPRNETSAINNLVRSLKALDLCPALVFTFSRAKCELLASVVSERFHEADVQSQIEQCINGLLTRYQYDFQETRHLPQIRDLTELAKRGVAYHHSGLLPFAKEIVEILFSKGLIKVLFVTETFSVGINMPTRTVVFTDLSKNTGGKIRNLYTDEFYQMAGRAGRRGLDTKGTVIYMPTRRMLSLSEIRGIIEGQPMSVRSHYVLDYHTVLQRIANGQQYETVRLSYLYQELDRHAAKTAAELELVTSKLQHLEQQLSETLGREAGSLFDRFLELETEEHPQSFGGVTVTVNPKALKRIRTDKEKIRRQYKELTSKSESGRKTPSFDAILKMYREYSELRQTETRMQSTVSEPDAHLKSRYTDVVDVLVKSGFIKPEYGEGTVTGPEALTSKGLTAARINNADGILVATLVDAGRFNGLETRELGMALSLLTAELSGRHEGRLEDCPHLKDDRTIEWLLQKFRETNVELVSDLERYEEVSFPTDLLEASWQWLRGDKFLDVAGSLGELQGNFVRSMLRLLRLCEELIAAFETTGQQLELEGQLRELMTTINRGVVVFDSIYIKGGT